MIRIKRVYEKSERKDGTRILVDGIWPRGVSKASAHLDLWLKEVAPSTELRQWFGHDPVRWEEFRSRYFGELADKEDATAQIRAATSKGDSLWSTRPAMNGTTMRSRSSSTFPKRGRNSTNHSARPQRRQPRHRVNSLSREPTQKEQQQRRGDRRVSRADRPPRLIHQ